MESIMNRTITSIMKKDGSKYKIQYNDAPDRETYDVFFARGHKFDSYPGNKLYRRAVRLYSHLYKQSFDLREKKAFADNVINSIRSKRGRFFHQAKKDKDTYEELDSSGKELGNKVRQSLRDEKGLNKEEEEEVFKVDMVQLDHRHKRCKGEKFSHCIKNLSDVGGFCNSNNSNLLRFQQDCCFSRANHEFNGVINSSNRGQDEDDGIRPYQDLGLNKHRSIPSIIITKASIHEEHSIHFQQQQQQQHHQRYYAQHSRAGSECHLEANKRKDMNVMYNSQQDHNQKVKQITSLNQSFITAISDKEKNDCQENDQITNDSHFDHQNKDANNQPLKEISEDDSDIDENDISENLHMMEVDEVYENQIQNHVQDARNDEHQQHTMTFLTSSSTKNDADLQVPAQMFPSSNLPIATSQHSSFSDYLEQLPAKQFQPICNLINKTEQPEPEFRPQTKLQLESMSAINQSDDNELAYSELDEIMKRPLLSPDPSISSHSNRSIEGDLDITSFW